MQTSTEYEKSRLAFIFGDEFQSPKSFLNFEIYANDQKSQEQFDKLKSIYGENLDIDNSLVVKWKCLPGKKHLMKKVLEEIKLEDYEIKTYVKGDDFVHFSVRLTRKKEAEVVSIIKALQDSGLNKITATQKNQLVGTAQLNYSFAKILERMQKGERILSAVLNNVKFELLLTIHTNLSANLKEVVANIHEAFNYSPPMQLLTYFKNFDIDLAFESTEEMTNDIKNELLFGKIFQETFIQDRTLTANEFQTFYKLIESCGDHCELYLTSVNLGAAKFEIQLPDFSLFFQQYGRIIMNYSNIFNWGFFK